MENKHADQSSYIIDSSSGAEMARLIDQDLMLTGAIGVFPTDLDLMDVYRLLDVACGPGGWARVAARQLPDTTVVGVDINQDMIQYANAFAHVEKLKNLSCRVLDVRQPLPFDDASFDLVHARLLIGLIYKRVWPSLVKEYVRITRSGGWIVLTESDKFASTNSQAEETLMGLGLDAMVSAGFYAGISGNQISPHLASFLADAGVQDIQVEHYTIDVSSGTTAYHALVSNLKIALLLLQPFILKMGRSSKPELAALYEQTVQDLESSDFRGQVDLVRAWGRKP